MLKRWTWVAVFAVVSVWLTASSAEPLSLEEIVQLRNVTAIDLAPDGSAIAYLLSVPRVPYVDDAGRARSELHVTDLDGNSRVYVSGDFSVGEVIWANDASRLYYLAERDDDEAVALYQIAIDGGESRKVYEHPTSMSGIRQSPDGRFISFRAVRERPEGYETLQEKGFKAVVYEESVRFSDVWLLEIGSDEPEASRVELPGHPSALEWSPDSRRYAVALAPTPLVDDSYVRRGLYIVDAAEGRVERRVEHIGKLGPFVWSPDSTRVAFIGAADANDPLEGRVYVASADGERVESLTPDYPGHVHEVAWRDNESLWYRSSRGLWTEIDTLATSRESVLPALRTGNPIAHDFDIESGADSVALIADTPTHPREVYLWSERSGYRRLTESNPILNERDLAEQEALSFEARDGLLLEGVLIKPMGVEGDEPAPLILAIHGGPESHYSFGWMSGYTFPAQTLAAEGYAVFYPNYRASTGRGVVFSKLDHGDPAGREFDDLVDAKAHLVEIGIADPERVGISGGSYGGYATMWASTALTEHFAAGVAFVGISDLIGFMGTSDIPYEMQEVHFRTWPWDDWEFALERSPLYHAGNARTPLLILGGDADPRVHPSQSLALYRYLKLLTDTPVRLVRYPGEGHGNAETAARLDYSMRMKRWMDHYLKGAGGEPPPHELDHAARLTDTGD